MASSALSSLPLLLVTAGLALLAASLRLTCLARRHRQCMEKLLQLANGKLEPLELPAAAWPLLAEAGWRHLTWEGVWFGQPIAGTQGNAVPPTSNALCFAAGSDETRLHLRFSHSGLRGEKRLFADQLAHVFVLMLETRLRARSEALAAALAQRARLSLYLQHDMRNLAQWVSWVSADFASAPDNMALQEAACRLRDNAPLARERAERLIAALGQSAAAERPETIDVRQAIDQAAQLAGFVAQIDGEAEAWMDKNLLNSALDNLFTGLAAVWRDPLAIRPVFQLRPFSGTFTGKATEQNLRQSDFLPSPSAGEGQGEGEYSATSPPLPQPLPSEDGGEQVDIEFFCPWSAANPALPAEKLFEPFASGRPGGLGLGLYQARKSLAEGGGRLEAQPMPEGLLLLLRLPKQRM